MTKTQLLRRTRGRLGGLSEEHLRVADYFLAWLEQCESDDMTAELLRIPGFAEDFDQGCKEADEGKLTDFDDIPWDA
jgi:hypothetical protein